MTRIVRTGTFMGIVFGIVFVSLETVRAPIQELVPPVHAAVFVQENTLPPLTIQSQEISSVSHLPMPQPVRGVYMTGWTAGTTSGKDHILGLFEGTVLNTVVIDIKDATGRLSYQPLDLELGRTGVGTNRIKDITSLIDTFHKRGIYVIGRLTVFQDPFYAQQHPEDAYLDTRTGLPWTDRKGLAWLRPNAEAVRDYIVKIARDAYAQGFDEINVDYVRFPSDGDIKYLDLSSFTKNKEETMQDFFTALRVDLSEIPLSADVFGLTMSAPDDVGIGQKAVLIAPSVDALSPMVYPSHFWEGTYGIAVPAKEPYKVIYTALAEGIKKLASVGIDKERLRPWLQDFALLGVQYGAQDVRAQIQAAHDLGIDAWLIWDPRNIYHKDAFIEPEVGLEPTTTRLQNGSSTN